MKPASRTSLKRYIPGGAGNITGTLLATSFGFIVVQLDVTIVNVALPEIGSSLQTGVSGLQGWLTLIPYHLLPCCLQPDLPETGLEAAMFLMPVFYYSVWPP